MEGVADRDDFIPLRARSLGGHVRLASLFRTVYGLDVLCEHKPSDRLAMGIMDVQRSIGQGAH